ncbi:hypothetical protein LTR64_003573 [Lithohypha guttulata]|uniref:FAD-binding domain-containing protein n=1 Tax=Lithohypha guttulata TaxID=1690604 RepID=A0AAN7SZ51_9EURO|nr:hypothetical protein LTR51_000207 [Lithohypha guttulata]KAK5085400.1 hypothetical protein LTR05_004685 [Lithohypha guttulata]
MAGIEQHDIAIIGDGPVGLTCSILLSLRGIDNVVFERYPDTSIHPKACGINQRTTEIFRIIGIEDEVYEHCAPPEIAGRTACYTSLGAEGREIVSRDAWGGGIYAEEYERLSSSRYCILPQIRLEPILRRIAVALNLDGVRYATEVRDLEQFEDHVKLTVRSRDEDYSVKARSFIAADGGRPFTTKLGVSWLGERNIFDMVFAQFRSPLRSLHPDPRNFITWSTNPKMGGSTKTGYLYQIGPWPLQPGEEEWVFACGVTEHDPERFDQQTMIDRLRRTLNIADLPVELRSFSHWNVNAISRIISRR